MAKRLIWAQGAWSDFETAADHIANDSPMFAHTFAAEIKQAASGLISSPGRGRIVPEIAKSVACEVSPAGYRLIYRVSSDTVTILALIQRARDWHNVVDSA